MPCKNEIYNFTKYVKEEFGYEIDIKKDSILDTFEKIFGIDVKIDSPCDRCSNNPKNGGSGFCNCTLATPIIY